MSRRARLWIQAGIIAGAVCLLIAGAIVYDTLSNSPTVFHKLNFLRPPDPVYQWVESDTRGFDFMPGEGKAWGPVEAQQGEIRYEIRSSLPIDTGLMDTKWADRMDAWAAMRTASSCYESSIRKSAKVCRISSSKPQLIFVRDLRAKQAGLTLEEMFGTKSRLQEPTEVKITILAWKCVENCKYALR